jgi:hypothetical protein
VCSSAIATTTGGGQELSHIIQPGSGFSRMDGQSGMVVQAGSHQVGWHGSSNPRDSGPSPSNQRLQLALHASHRLPLLALIVGFVVVVTTS